MITLVLAAILTVLERYFAVTDVSVITLALFNPVLVIACMVTRRIVTHDSEKSHQTLSMPAPWFPDNGDTQAAGSPRSPEAPSVTGPNGDDPAPACQKTTRFRLDARTRHPTES
jgi:hypothetical protein